MNRQSSFSPPPLPLGMIDTLSAGLGIMVRHGWLLVLPIAFDFFLWLAPPLVMGISLQSAMIPPVNVKTFLAGAPDAEMVAQVQTMYDGLLMQVAQTNFWGWAVPSGLFFPSVMAGTPLTPNVMVLAIHTPWSFVGLFVALTFLGIFVNVAWLHTVAFATTRNPDFLQIPTILRAFGRLVLLILLALFILMGLVLVASLLLAVFTLLLPVGGAALGTLVLLLATWWLVWIGVQLYFTIAALIVGRQGVFGAPNTSTFLLRRHPDNPHWRSGYGFIGLSVILTWGFAFIWQSLMMTSIGRVVSIIGNAALGTGITAAMMLFYHQRTLPQPKEQPVTI